MWTLFPVAVSAAAGHECVNDGDERSFPWALCELRESSPFFVKHGKISNSKQFGNKMKKSRAKIIGLGRRSNGKHKKLKRLSSTCFNSWTLLFYCCFVLLQFCLLQFVLFWLFVSVLFCCNFDSFDSFSSVLFQSVSFCFEFVWICFVTTLFCSQQLVHTQRIKA